jgi:hypothetical protein
MIQWIESLFDFIDIQEAKWHTSTISLTKLLTSGTLVPDLSKTHSPLFGFINEPKS